MFIRPSTVSSTPRNELRPSLSVAQPEQMSPAFGDQVELSEEAGEEPLRQGFFARLFSAFGRGQSPASEAVSEALQGDGRGRFVNGIGQEIDFHLSRDQDSARHEGYWLSLGEDRIRVNVQHGLDSERALSRVADFYSQQDESLRGVVSTVNLEAGANPDDERIARERNLPRFRSAATGGGGTITFYNGLRNLNEDTFSHEFGHNLGFAVRTRQDAHSQASGNWERDRQMDALTGDHVSPNVPRGYSQAAQADARMVSRYGQQTISEDFAEFYEAYLDARNAGPETLASFENRYPHRFSVLNEWALDGF